VIGCARRSLTITSDPSAALVYLNGEEIGRTPLTYDFEWYGNYDVMLREDGFETLKTHRNLKAPAGAIPPFDLLGELLGVKDRRQWHFKMTPANPQAVDPQVLINRGIALKEDLRSSEHTRRPATFPTSRPATAPSTRAGQ
jgi:hypothetical protein